MTKLIFFILRCFTHRKECRRVPASPEVTLIPDVNDSPLLPSSLSKSADVKDPPPTRRPRRRVRMTGVAAGSPCTDFSNIGARLGASGPTALFLTILIKMVLTRLPSWVIHENVLEFPLAVLMSFWGGATSYSLTSQVLHSIIIRICN